MKAEGILEKFRLKHTPLRKQMLSQFIDSDSALSHKDIEDKLAIDFDRVTIYRNLKSFEQKGIIHLVRSDQNVAMYALCHEDCSDHKHEDSHVHFKCNICEKTFCLEEVQIPNIHLPKGYSINELSYLVIGKCDDCNQ